MNLRHWLISRQAGFVWRDIATVAGAIVTVLGLAALVAFAGLVVMSRG